MPSEEVHIDQLPTLNRCEDVQIADDSISNGSSPSVVTTTSLTSSRGRSAIISHKHYDGLVSELRCPGCAKPMVPPIFMCESGHSICKLCCVVLSNCPLCKNQFTKMRSVTLEAIAAKAHFNCPNSVRGCAVRVPLDLMKWHKSRCLYQRGECFMGKVWGECNWSGGEFDWISHCLERHTDKVFLSSNAEIQWKTENYQIAPKPIHGYFIFKAYGETFNLYQIQDKRKSAMLWTLICASRASKINRKFAYQIEIFLPGDQTRVIIQRHACHAENDQDILDDGRCISIMISDVLRFIDGDKVLHYRCKIIELNCFSDDNSAVEVKQMADMENKICADCTATHIANTNLKNIPAKEIITRAPEMNSTSEVLSNRGGMTLKQLMDKEFTIVSQMNAITKDISISKPPRKFVTTSKSVSNETEPLLDETPLPSLPDTPAPVSIASGQDGVLLFTRANVHVDC